MNTKEKILAAALKLFNTHGLENVTTRHIAIELGMSQGNLHYHFSNKNEVIRQLYNDFKTGLSERSGYSTGNFGLAEIENSLERNFDWMHRYRFLFLDREIIWRRIPEIKRETQAFILVKKRQLYFVIDKLKSDGIFRPDINDSQISGFLDMYQVMINSWLTSVYLFSIIEPVSFFARQAFRLWYPYLTPKGQFVFEAI